MVYRDLEDRLLSNSVLDIETGCWLWLGCKNPKGYGELKLWCKARKKHVKRYAHRIAFEVFTGQILKPGEEIDHWICDNSSCINPMHHKVVSKTQNVTRANQRRRRS